MKKLQQMMCRNENDKIILEEIELDLRDEDFNPFSTSVVKGYNQYIEWGLGS